MRHGNNTGMRVPDRLPERIVLEDRCQQAVLAHVDAEHTALRAFGPHAPLDPIPDEHLITYFARRLDPSAHEPMPSLEVLDRLPECDQCGPAVLARYADVLRHRDGRLLNAQLCRSCHRMGHAPRSSLITSVRLVLLAEASDDVRDQVNARALREGIPSPWADDDLEPDWRRNYRACGFGEPDADGELGREILGESVWVRMGADGMVRLIATHRDRTRTFTSTDNYTAPATWTEDQVRHLLRQIFPLTQRTDSCARLEDPLPAAEARVRRALDRDGFPETLLDDVPATVRASARLPHGPSLSLSDAQRCAHMTRDTELLRRITTEHPALTVRHTARSRLEQLGTRAEMRRFRASDPDNEFDWITWENHAPHWATGRFAARRWKMEAGIYDALFSLDGDPEMRWDHGLRSRPAIVV